MITRKLSELATTPAGKSRRILGTSYKVLKGLKYGVETVVLYLSPSDESGCNLCPWATEGCAKSCLGHSSGHLQTTQNQLVRVAKSQWWLQYRDHFLAQLRAEIHAHVRKAQRKGMIPAVRLNGSSDVLWERWIDMEGEFSHVQFYDYTKAPLSARTLPNNYHVTFSLSEAPGSMAEAQRWLRAGHNVAIVVRTPEQAAAIVRDGYAGFPAVDGDESDVRFEDPPGHWVALYAKGAAKRDVSGFVQDVCTEAARMAA